MFLDRGSRREAIEFAQGWLKLNPVFLDTETTGVDNKAEMVEIGIVDASGILFSSLVKPSPSVFRTLTPENEALRVNGIKLEDVAKAPEFAFINGDVAGILHGRRVCTYNAEFDRRIMDQSTLGAGLGMLFSPTIPWLCAMKLFAQFTQDWNPKFQNWRWVKLGLACDHFGIKPEGNLHRAATDAWCAMKIVEKIAEAKP